MTGNPVAIISALAEASFRASLIIVMVGFVLTALRVRPGGVKHAAWTAVLVAMLLLPLLPKWLPAIPVTFVPERVVAAVAGASIPSADTAPTHTAAPVAPAAANTPRATTAPAPVSQAPASPVRPIDWSAIFVMLWALGALLMLARLVVGWRHAARLAAGSCPSSLDPALFESDLVATPVTVGVFRPRIVVPVSWMASPDDTRAAVLMHERAHIRRHDTLINFVAGVNRCVFWFHPLAWWLERRVSVAAEQACDDQVIRTCGNSTRYAELLVEMAEAVRARGARVEWQGVGMAGSGSLGARIDRVLSGGASTAMTRARKIVVALTCATAIVLGIACERSVPPLRPDPEVAARLAQQKARGEKYEAARTMTMEQVTAAEAAVAKNPEDLETTEKLLVFYQQSGQRSMGWNEMVAARRPHLLRMIEHHPESDLAAWPFKQSLDPAGYAEARALWMKHVGRPDVTPKILGGAASFFNFSEKPMAEQLLVRAKALDPTGPQPRVVDNIYHSPWSARLGNLYASAIIDADTETLGDSSSSTSPADPNQSFAAESRKKLAASTDPQLLRSAGLSFAQNVRQNYGRSMTGRRTKVVSDQRVLGESCLDRSIALDPNSEATKQLVSMRQREAHDQAQNAKRRAVLDEHGKADEAKLAGLSESDRLEVLPMLAIVAYMGGEDAEWNHRPTYQASFAQAKRLADDALALAAKLKTGPAWGASVYSAHVTRGLIALRDGDRRLAVTHMRAATDGLEEGDTLDGDAQAGQPRLCNYLLTAGERESVAEFYERSSKFAQPNAKLLVDAAKAIREGRMPMGYQYAVTPH